MSNSIIKKEFYNWITTLDQTALSDIDKKFLNLLINNFDKIAPLVAARGLRVKEIGQLIEQSQDTISSELPDLSNLQTLNTDKHDRIEELQIGPFRGFSYEETFIFDKKYTFMYGPNGSGKSSFCEGLEYALLGTITEAESKRIDLETYLRNIQTGKVKDPILYGLDKNKQKLKIDQNQIAYHFSFVEKNRIDNFARISATTPSSQKDRIATLFGLDLFSNFVDGFSSELSEKYITLINVKENDFNEKNQEFETSNTQISSLDKELEKQTELANLLIKEVSQEDVTTLEELKVYLSGKDEKKGKIDSLFEKQAVNVPDDVDSSIVETSADNLKGINEILHSLNKKISELGQHSSEVNYKDLYTAIGSITKDTHFDNSVCPACKTPVDKVTVNPFDNAITELQKFEKLINLQKEIKENAISLSEKVRKENGVFEKINEIMERINYEGKKIPLFKDISFTDNEGISSWKDNLAIELQNIEESHSETNKLFSEIQVYNHSLQGKREEKNDIEKEIAKYQGFKKRLDIIYLENSRISTEINKLQELKSEFLNKNEKELEEIENINKKIAVNKKYVDSYHNLVGKLKEHRDNLPLQLSSNLSDKAMAFYNIINDHDPSFEKLQTLNLPTKSNEEITIRFQGETGDHNALLILSEGHIKVLGLSILLSKIVNDDLGFIIFDDIVNAIDDDHRDGIAELLLTHSELKDRQLIILCHGEMFVQKLENRLGASKTDKEVTRYKFVPCDNIDERGVKISNGAPKHYLLQAKKSLKENDLKDCAFRCRQAIESISEQLWKKLNKLFNANLSVQMRNPSSRPELGSIIDGLIKALGKITGADELKGDLQKLNENNCKKLLNKGAHEQSDLPEFNFKEVSKLLNLIENIEKKVQNFKVEVSAT